MTLKDIWLVHRLSRLYGYGFFWGLDLWRDLLSYRWFIMADALGLNTKELRLYAHADNRAFHGAMVQAAEEALDAHAV